MKDLNCYVLPVEFTIIQKEGSGMVLTIADISNALENKGCTVYLAQDPFKDPSYKVRLIVYPPRHIVTGEDMRFEMEEKLDKELRTLAKLGEVATSTLLPFVVDLAQSGDSRANSVLNQWDIKRGDT